MRDGSKPSVHEPEGSIAGPLNQKLELARRGRDEKAYPGRYRKRLPAAREIETAERFAGRQGAVSDAYYALVGEGTNIAVVGNRGIGKSSLARQIGIIAGGDNSLLQRLELPHDHTDSVSEKSTADPSFPIRLGGRAKATPYCLQSWRIQIAAHLCAILRSLTHAPQCFSDQQFSLLSPFARHRFC
jgi:hypothetical protein